MTTDTLTDTRPTRRAVTRAAAWSVPVIATSATVPAYAASCTPVRVSGANITTYSRTSSIRWTATFDSDGAGPLPSNVMTVDATYDAGMTVRNDNAGGTNDNFTLLSPVGGLGVAGLVMAQRPLAGSTAPLAAFGHYRFSFTRAVTNLSFTLTDIDSATNDFIDSVVLTPGFTVSGRAGALQGAGTTASPFRPVGDNSAVDNASGSGGNVTITYAGPLSSFTIDYRNAAASFSSAIDQDQLVTLANIAFDYQPC